MPCIRTERTPNGPVQVRPRESLGELGGEGSAGLVPLRLTLLGRVERSMYDEDVVLGATIHERHV